jgi:hypothetical protein
MKEMLPVGVRRDGSFYTRIEWVSHTESNPLLWVCNVIDDDTERNGGTWGANTNGPADLVLSFFSEEQELGKFRFFHNVGISVSILEELAKKINIYVSLTDEPRKLKSNEDNIEDVPWTPVASFDMKKEEAWQEFELEKPVSAKYVRLELVENFGTPPHIPWTETSEIKIYPPA